MSLIQRRGMLDSVEGLVQYIREIANVDDSQIRQIVENAKAELARDQAKRSQDLTSKFTMTEEDQAELWELEREMHAMDSERTQATMLPYVLRNAMNFIVSQKTALEKKQAGLRNANNYAERATQRMLEYVIASEDASDFEQRRIQVLEKESADVHFMYELIRKIKPGYDFKNFRDATIEDLVSGVYELDGNAKGAAVRLVAYAGKLKKLQGVYCTVLLNDADKRLAEIKQRIPAAEEKATEVWDEISQKFNLTREKRDAHVQNARSPLEQLTPVERSQLYEKAKSDASFRHIYDAYKRAALNTKEDKIDGLREAEFMQLFRNYLNGDVKFVSTLGGVVEQLKKSHEWAYLLFNVDNKPKLHKDNGPLSIEEIFLMDKPAGNPAPQQLESPGAVKYDGKKPGFLKRLFGYFM